MSLRTKSLFAVLVLVSAIIGGLVFYVKAKYTVREREKASQDLETDAARLRDVLEAEAVGINKSLRLFHLNPNPGKDLKNYADFVKYWREKDGLKANFNTIAAEWYRTTETDYSLAALNSFSAEEAKATILHEENDLAIIGAETSEKGTQAQLTALWMSPAVNQALNVTASEVKTHIVVVPAGKALFLMISMPYFEDIGDFEDFLRFERILDGNPNDTAAATDRRKLAPYGVCAVFTELSGSWADKHSLEAQNPIRQVFFTGTEVTATKSLSTEHAKMALQAHLRNPASHDFELEIDGETFIGHSQGFDLEGSGNLRFPAGLIALKSLDRELLPLRDLVKEVTVAGVAIALLGALFAYAMAYLVIRKLGVLQVATERVKGGDFAVSVDIKGRDEIAQLGGAFNNMIKGLRLLGLYTDTKLARSALDNSELVIGGDSARHEGTVLFTDIAGFTTITESMNPITLTEQLNEYFTAIGEHVKKEDGYVDKFIGDAVMAFWGRPFLVEQDYAVRACRAALRSMNAIAELRRFWKEHGRPLFYQRIGIATGEVVVGNIGSQAKKNFTVIGDSVNLASRLEGASKIYGTEIIADERTIELAGKAVLAREIDEIKVRGKLKPVRIYEVLGMSADTGTRALRIIAGYGKALARYRAQDYEGAISALDELAKTDPEDGPSKWLRVTCAGLMGGGQTPAPTPITRSFGQPDKAARE